MDIVLENKPGFCAINLYYVFNTNYFALTKVENQATTFTMTHVTTTVWDAISNFTEDATLGVLHFDVAENTPAGEYEVEILFLSAANDAFVEITAQTVSATLSVEFKFYRNNQEYRCEITDSDGNTDTTNIVKIVAKEVPLAITVHPVDCLGAVNDNVTMTVEATGTNLTYKWYRSNDKGVS